MIFKYEITEEQLRKIEEVFLKIRNYHNTENIHHFLH
jgi:hypothetical protein